MVPLQAELKTLQLHLEQASSREARLEADVRAWQEALPARDTEIQNLQVMPPLDPCNAGDPYERLLQALARPGPQHHSIHTRTSAWPRWIQTHASVSYEGHAPDGLHASCNGCSIRCSKVRSMIWIPHSSELAGDNLCHKNARGTLPPTPNGAPTPRPSLGYHVARQIKSGRSNERQLFVSAACTVNAWLAMRQLVGVLFARPSSQGRECLQPGAAEIFTGLQCMLLMLACSALPSIFPVAFIMSFMQACALSSPLGSSAWPCPDRCRTLTSLTLVASVALQGRVGM